MKQIGLLVGGLLLIGHPTTAHAQSTTYTYCWIKGGPGAAWEKTYTFVKTTTDFAALRRNWFSYVQRLTRETQSSVEMYGCAGPFDSEEEAEDALNRDHHRVRGYYGWDRGF